MAKRRIIQVPTFDDNKDDSFNEKIDPVNRFKVQKQLKETTSEFGHQSSENSAINNATLPIKKVVCNETSKQPSTTQIKQTNQNGENPTNLKCPSTTAKSEICALAGDKISIPKSSGKTNSILVNTRQRGNPILKFVRNVPLEYSDIIPDYVLGQTTCALYLSLRYHVLNPNYIHERLKQLGRQFALRVLLVQVDVKDPHHSIKELTKISIFADCTLLLAWSPEESGRYLEAYKVFENKPADLLMEKQEDNPMAKLVDAMTNIKSVNRTNAKTLLSTFRSFKNVAEADTEILAFCPGVGPRKLSTEKHNLL